MNSLIQAEGTGDDSSTWLDNLSDKTLNVEKQAISERDFLQIYNWTVEAVRGARKRFLRNPSYYEAIISGRIFTRVPFVVRDIARQFEVSPQTVLNDEQIIRKMITDQFPHSGYEAFQKSTPKREHAKTLTINGMDIHHTYNWIMAAVRKEGSFRKEPAYYEAIINGLIFTFFPRSVPDIADEFNVGYRVIIKAEQIIRQMIKDQLPHSGYETFQKSTPKREHAKTLTINGMDIQHTYNWIMAAVRKEGSFRKEPAYYEAIINGLIFTFFPRFVPDIAKKFKVHSDSVIRTERIIRKMIKDQFSHLGNRASQESEIS